jgi:diguanylate cyclase (GGDEF)-like protein
MSGQRFALLLPNADTSSATQIVENVRREIESLQFVHGESTIGVTVSCGVASAVADDSTEMVLQRVAGALREAKQGGRNRTVVDDGQHSAAAVVESTAAIPARVITL